MVKQTRCVCLIVASALVATAACSSEGGGDDIPHEALDSDTSAQMDASGTADSSADVADAAADVADVTADVADVTAASSLFETRYCEVLLVELDGDAATLSVFNTVGHNECPTELWEVLDTEEITQEQGVTAAVLNGPRFWTIDNALAGAAVTGEVEDFGGIAMGKVAEIQLTLAQLIELQRGARPYVELVVNRDNTWIYAADREVYELVDPDGQAYIMQSFSHQVDDTLTSEDLASLGERLQLPEGWTFQTRLLPTDLNVQATGQATIVQDELRNTYQKH